MRDDQIRQEDDRLIIGDVARAVEERELTAYYQPVIELATGRVAAAEALVRWTMPDGTVVPAGLFVPSLERTDTILGLDWFMAEEVSAFLAKAKGTPAAVPCSLNFSVRHAADPDFADKLIATTSWHGIDPVMVRAEFGADKLLAADHALDHLLSSVLAHGFTGTVDGFSQGLSGLIELADKGVSVVKVASSYWRHAPIGELTEVVEAAHERNMVISAEGTEDERELEVLAAAGFRFAQGYYFAHPMDRAAFEAFCA